jgi:Holliday junction resolvasome RuvABC endonuclease subunit
MTATNIHRLLSIDLCNRGIGFIVLEPPDRLVDWGIKRVANTDGAKAVAAVRDLLELYRPGLLVLEDCTGRNNRRGARVRLLIFQFMALAKEKRTPVKTYSVAQVQKAFAKRSAFTKRQIACAVALQLPVLVRFLPPLRKIWMSEDPRSSIFDAAAFALTYMDGIQGQNAADFPF